MNQITAPFGDMMKRWRTSRRLSQLDLALTAQVSARHLSFIETGRARPSRQMVIQLAEALDVPLARSQCAAAGGGFRAGLSRDRARCAGDGAHEIGAAIHPRPPRALWRGGAGPALEHIDVQRSDGTFRAVHQEPGLGRQPLQRHAPDVPSRRLSPLHRQLAGSGAVADPAPAARGRRLLGRYRLGRSARPRCCPIPACSRAGSTPTSSSPRCCCRCI